MARTKQKVRNRQKGTTKGRPPAPKVPKVTRRGRLPWDDDPAADAALREHAPTAIGRVGRVLDAAESDTLPDEVVAATLHGALVEHLEAVADFTPNEVYTFLLRCANVYRRMPHGVAPPPPPAGRVVPHPDFPEAVVRVPEGAPA